MSGLAEVLPRQEVIQFNGQDLVVRAVPLRSLSVFYDAFNRLFASVQTLSTNPALTVGDLLAVGADHAEDLATLCACCCVGLDREAVLDQPTDVALPLLDAVLRVNSDFFLRAMPERLLAMVTILIPGDGATPSNS